MSKKQQVRNAGIQVGHHTMDANSLRASAKAEPEGFVHKVADLVENGNEERGVAPLRWQQVRNVKALQDALADVVVPAFDATNKRSVDTSAFQALTSNMTTAGINDAYMAVPTIGEELVTEFDDAKKITAFAGVVHLIDPLRDRVDEAKPFPLMGAAEERYFIHHQRNGARIVLSQELFEESDLAGIVSRIDALGEWMAETIEKKTLRRIFDVDGAAGAEPYVFRPDSGASALYVATNAVQTRVTDGNLIANNALVDSTDLENARVKLAAMKNSRGERIDVFGSELTLLVPDALWQTAWQIKNSVLEPGVWNQKAFYGSEGPVPYRILSSSKIDDLSTSTWGLGNYRKQFLRKWKLRPEVVVAPGQTPASAQAFLDARIGYQARVAFDFEVGARDQGVYVTKNTA